jgi:hypothetical protein
MDYISNISNFEQRFKKMKRTINFFTAFIIFTTAFSLSAFCPNINAQDNSNSSTKKKTKRQIRKEKLEEREVRRFANQFIRSLEVTYDLDKVPKRFFDNGFRKRMSEDSNWDLLSLENEDLKKQFSDDERYLSNVSFINFFNSLGIFVLNKFKNQEEDNELDDEIVKSLPPHIFKLLERSKWLKPIFVEGKNEGEIVKSMTPADYRSFMADLNAVSDAMRREIKKRKLNFPLKYRPNPELQTEYFPPEKCEGDRCMGLPENTTIFAIHKYLMCLRIIKIKNELKIVNIYFAALEN